MGGVISWGGERREERDEGKGMGNENGKGRTGQ